LVRALNHRGTALVVLEPEVRMLRSQPGVGNAGRAHLYQPIGHVVVDEIILIVDLGVDGVVGVNNRIDFLLTCSRGQPVGRNSPRATLTL